MKILYAIQGTGNGHLSRALELYPIMQKYGSVDVLVSGINFDIKLPFPVKYSFNGLGFVFGKKGGIDMFQTYKKNKIKLFLREIKSLPVDEYDLIITDFEPISAWAAYLNRKPCVGIGNQVSLLSEKSPRPEKKDIVGDFVLRWYAPTASWYGFHFKSYDKNIHTPTIRKNVRQLKTENKGYYTVYLPAYSNKRILKILNQLTDVNWEVFSKHEVQEKQLGHIKVKPIGTQGFIESMAAAEGVLCGAGFATPAEALFLKKKLMVVPMKGQYEQQCNAAALEQLGVKVIKSFKEKHLARIKQWVSEDQMISIDFPDNSESLIEKIMSDFNGNKIEITKDKLTIPAIETYSKIFKKGKPNYFFKIFKG